MGIKRKMMPRIGAVTKLSKTWASGEFPERVRCRNKGQWNKNIKGRHTSYDSSTLQIVLQRFV